MTIVAGNVIQNRPIIAVIVNQHLKSLASVVTAFTGLE